MKTKLLLSFALLVCCSVFGKSPSFEQVTNIHQSVPIGSTNISGFIPDANFNTNVVFFDDADLAPVVASGDYVLAYYSVIDDKWYPYKFTTNSGTLSSFLVQTGPDRKWTESAYWNDVTGMLTLTNPGGGQYVQLGTNGNATLGGLTVNSIAASGSTKSISGFTYVNAGTHYGTWRSSTSSASPRIDGSGGGATATMVIDNSSSAALVSLTVKSTNTYYSGDITATNGYAGPTNPAPTSVTVGVTAPDAWISYVGTNGVTYKIPAWIDH